MRFEFSGKLFPFLHSRFSEAGLFLKVLRGLDEPGRVASRRKKLFKTLIELWELPALRVSGREKIAHVFSELCTK